MGSRDDFKIADSIADYRMLDLEPGESLENIKQAYRDLAFIWHPDRIPDNSRLKHKAEIKIKELNEAYQRLRFYQALLQSPTEVSDPVSAPTTHPTDRRSEYTSPQVHYKYWTHAHPQDNSVWLY